MVMEPMIAHTAVQSGGSKSIVPAYNGDHFNGYPCSCRPDRPGRRNLRPEPADQLLPASPEAVKGYIIALESVGMECWVDGIRTCGGAFFPYRQWHEGSGWEAAT